MKKQFNYFFSLIGLTFLLFFSGKAQTNSPYTVDSYYYSSHITPVFSYPNPPTPAPPNGLYFNMGSDFHPFCPSNIAAYLGNNTGEYVTVTDVVDALGGSTINIKSDSGDITSLLGGGYAIDPDVVVLGDMAICTYYLDNGTTWDFYADVYSNISSFTPTKTTTLLKSVPITSGFIPVINVDINSVGDIGIVYSYSPGIAEVYMKNVVKCLPTLDSLGQRTYLIPYSIYQPDIAILDYNKTSYTANAFLVGLDASSTSIDAYKVNSGLFSNIPIASGGNYFEPRIACPSYGSSSQSNWAVAVADLQTNNISIWAEIASIGLSSQVDVGATPTAQMYGTNINPTSVGTFNDRATISYTSCATILVNWINYNTQPAGTVNAIDNVLGVEIESFYGIMTIQNLFPVPITPPIIGASQLSLRLPQWAPQSVCGRFGNGFKFASFITDYPSFYGVGGYAKIGIKKYDCNNSLWRSVMASTNLNTKNITTSMNNSVQVFPNPCVDYVKISTKGQSPHIREISIINTLGQIVNVQSVNPNISNDIFINTNQLPAGNYLIRSTFEDGSIITKQISREE
jgi:hypothetical protein